MTDVEYMTHFSLWSIAKAPLIIGCDVRKISAGALSILTNREVIGVNQDPLGVQGKKVAVASSLLSNGSTGVIVANLSLTSMDPKRHQWIYNPEDGSIRSVHSGRCVSIDSCRTDEGADIVLSDCHVDDPRAPCQGKNQQWIRNMTSQVFVSQMNGKWYVEIDISKADNLFSFSLTLFQFFGPNVIAYTCNGKDNQVWTLNESDKTLSSKPRGQYLIVQPELEIWAAPLAGGSQAVVLLNVGDSGSSPITVQWKDIGFPTDHTATVRDLWAHVDLGLFTNNFTSPMIDAHAVMMLNITLTK